MLMISVLTEKGNAMVVDIGEVKKHIKPKADSTLRNMRKADLIEYIRCLEHNYNVAVSFNENQAKYIESLDVAKVRCGECKHFCEPFCIRRDDETHRERINMMTVDFCSYGERKNNGQFIPETDR